MRVYIAEAMHFEEHFVKDSCLFTKSRTNIQALLIFCHFKILIFPRMSLHLVLKLFIYDVQKFTFLWKLLCQILWWCRTVMN